MRNWFCPLMGLPSLFFECSNPAFTTAFWDSTLQGNPAATSWLQEKDARSVLHPEDAWQWNGK